MHTSTILDDVVAYAPTPSGIELATDAALDDLWLAKRRRLGISNVTFEDNEENSLDLQFTVEINDECELPFELHALRVDVPQRVGELALDGGRLPPYDGEGRHELKLAIAIIREQIANEELDGPSVKKRSRVAKGECCHL